MPTNSSTESATRSANARAMRWRWLELPSAGLFNMNQPAAASVARMASSASTMRNFMRAHACAPSRRRQRVLVLLATLLGMALTARLGFWQLDRAAQKQALHQLLLERAAQTPLAGAPELARVPEQALAQWYRPIALQGQWVRGHTVFLDNRQMGARPGFFVLTPLRLQDGSAVLVQRGWVPRDMQERTRLPALPLPAGEVSVQGRVAPWPSRLADLGVDASGPIRQNLAATAFAQETGLALRPLSVVELAPVGHATSAVGTDGLKRDWPLPAADVQKHYGYAAQWFGFCSLMAGLYVWFELLRPWRARRAA
jgi:surfeit locus 1 family protein